MGHDRYNPHLPASWSISWSISSHSHRSSFLRIANLLRMLKKTGPMPVTIIFSDIVESGLENFFDWIPLHTTSYSLQTIFGSRLTSPGKTVLITGLGTTPENTISPHFWLRYFLPSLELDIAKTAVGKKWRKTQLFKSKLLLFKWALIK